MSCSGKKLDLIFLSGYPGRYQGQIYFVSSLCAYLWKRWVKSLVGMNYFTVASQIVSLIPKYLTPRFVVSVTFLKQRLVIKRRVTGVKDRAKDIFPLPATGDSKYKFLFLNKIYFELLLQHCHLVLCLCPGASSLPQEELWISSFPPQAFLGHFGELCFSLCHESLQLPKQ